jgi:hypothetical protein
MSVCFVKKTKGSNNWAGRWKLGAGCYLVIITKAASVQHKNDRLTPAKKI